MTGIGYGKIGENGIGGSTGGGIGIGGIGVGPVGGSTGHVSSSIGDSYRIERVNLPAVLEDSYDVTIAARVADSYLIALASTIVGRYYVLTPFTPTVSIIEGAYNVAVAATIGDSYQVLLAAILAGQYSIEYAGWLPTPATIVGAYEICRGILDHSSQYSSEYRYQQDFVIPLHFNDSTKYNYVFGQTATSSGQCLTIYRCEGQNSQYELYVGKNCRADFGDLYFYDTYHGHRMPHRLWRLRYDVEKQAEAVDVSIVLVNSTLYSSLPVRLYYGLDRADPSPEWPLNTWPAPGFIPFMVCNFPCNWGALTPKWLYPDPTGSYNIQVGRPAIGRYQIHLAKIMEG